ncbi:MAG: hypothetical protein ACE5JM_04225 [Armatimonadota bacterium]
MKRDQSSGAGATEHLPHPVRIEQFLGDPEYLGDDGRWPAIQDEEIQIVKRDPTEIALAWGTGAGKTALGADLFCYYAHRILPGIADGSFFQEYELRGDKPIFFFCLATRVEQARDNFFAEVSGRIARSPWFRKHFPPDERVHSRVIFTWKGERLPLVIQPLGCSERGPLAYDCYCCAIDEAGWFVESEGKLGDLAANLYHRIRSRISSRFLGHGILMNLSAPRYVDDFVQRRVRQIEKSADERLYASRKALWETHPQLIAELKDGKWLEVPHPDTGLLTRVPMSLQSAFESNADMAWRDFGAIPVGAFTPLDPKATVFLRKCATLPGPSSGADPGAVYYVHGDIGLTRDACAVAMVHVCGFTSDKEPIVALDRVEVVPRRPDTGQVEIEDVKRLILSWRDEGYQIAQASFDRFQSADLRQRLQRMGVTAKLVSVDRGIDAYNRLRALLHEGRFRHFTGTPAAETFEREYRSLELVEGVKVDHQPGGSKDVADAVAGAASEAVKALGASDGHIGFQML